MSVIKSQFTMRLDPVTRYKIKKISEEEMRSLTNMIEYLMVTSKNPCTKKKKSGKIEI